MRNLQLAKASQPPKKGGIVGVQQIDMDSYPEDAGSTTTPADPLNYEIQSVARVYCLMYSPWIRKVTLVRPRPAHVRLDGLEQFRDAKSREDARVAELMELLPARLVPIVISDQKAQRTVSTRASCSDSTL